ncbi:MAG: ABC transporter ATP-binding protein [Metamycoplasmataceae bacterium]
MVKNEKKGELSLKNNIKFIFWYAKAYKLKLIIIFIMTFFLTLILAGGLIAQYYFMQMLQIAAETNKINTTELIGYSIGIILGYILQVIIYVLQVIFMTKIAQKMGKQIRLDLYSKILDLKLAYFDTNPSGDIMSKLTNDVMNITNSLTQNTTQLLTQLFQMLWMLITAFLFSPILAAIAISLTPLQLGFIFVMTKKAKPLFLKKQNTISEMNSFVEEMVSGQKVINNFGKVNLINSQFDVVNEKLKKIDKKSNIISSSNAPWINFISGMAILISVVSGLLIYKNVEIGGITPVGNNPFLLVSLLFAFNMFYNGYSTPMFQIFEMWSVIQAALSGSQRVSVVYNEKEEKKENEIIDVNNLSGDVNIKNLNFSYDGKKQILKNINIHAKKNQVIGIVGPTGSGKTTIINLLTKFYDIEDGDIIFDNVSIKEISKQSLRDQISVVLQDTYIFEGSIYDNLRYAKEDATNKQIEEACILANADHFIMALKDGYNTILKNNAEEFSQGEKQLLAIARAILKKASILILDEATSFVDTKTEKDIREGMVFASKNKTTFIIAHRLSTIKSADMIVVLKDGEIIEKGKHSELIDLKGFYYNLYNSGVDVPEDVVPIENEFLTA